MKNSHRRSRRSGFTLIEMMVAIAILMTMLTIILVPMRLGLDSFAAGKTKSETQGALGVTISQIERDLRRAVIVFPNSDLAGVTSSTTYAENNGFPYYVAPDTAANKDEIVACLGGVRLANPSRIDMILAKRDSAGNLKSPIEIGDTVVSYYPRRVDITKPYDPIENPVELFRAEIPFRDPLTGDSIAIGSSVNADVSNKRYPASGDRNATTNRSTLWLGHNYYGEADLEDLTKETVTGTNLGSHSLVMPRGLGLVVTNGGCTTDVCAPGPLGLIPQSTFTTSDTNGDGKIDRVNISLAFTSFDASSSNRLRNNQPVGLQMRDSRTVDLPNIQ